MPRTTRPLALLILLALAAPSTALSQTAGYDDPLLSGYGNPGAAEQALFGGQVQSRGGGGGGTGSGSAPVDLRQQRGAAGSGAGAPSGGGSVPSGGSSGPSGGSSGRDAGGSRDGRTADRSRAGKAAARDGSTALSDVPTGGAVADPGTPFTVSASRPSLPIGAGDLLLLATFLAALLAALALGRRRSAS